MTKYIFVTGGVVSGLGKGITAASLGRLLKARGLKVAAQKLDPYINVDPGTMSPYQHGEVYVTEDGAETDLDLGHYERFIDEDLNKFSNLTTGKVYSNVVQRERQGGYLGSTVQTIPHITDEIKTFIYQVGKKTDAIGGTIGDIESQPFIEAIRQVGLEVGRENALYVHVTLVPYLKASGEHKSKPTQHSVKELQGMGIIPNIIVLRADEPIADGSIFTKIAHFCNVKPDCVIENRTLPNLYEAPLMLEEANLSGIVCRELHIDAPEPDLTEWRALVDRIRHQSRTVRIGLVGKYVQLHDAYLSVAEALRHAGYALDAKVNIEWIPFMSHTNLFISGAIDATLAMSYNELYQLIMSGQRLKKEQLMYMRNIGCNVPEDGLYVTRQFYKTHKMEVDKFVRASKKGWEYVLTHPKETMDIVLFYMRQSGIAANEAAQKWMLNECLRLLINPKTGKRSYKLAPEGLNLANSILLQGGELKKPVTYKQITEP